jgi:hypothetical protein
MLPQTEAEEAYEMDQKVGFGGDVNSPRGRDHLGSAFMGARRYDSRQCQ